MLRLPLAIAQAGLLLLLAMPVVAALPIGSGQASDRPHLPAAFHDNIRGRLDFADAARAYLPGTRAKAVLRLSTGGAGLPVRAAVVLGVERGRLGSIAGRGIRIQRNARGAEVEVVVEPGLEEVVTVEVIMPSRSAAQSPGSAVLAAALKQAGTDFRAIAIGRLVFQVADCPALFKSRLEAAEETLFANASAALMRASRPVEGFPGRWVYGPPPIAAVAQKPRPRPARASTVQVLTSAVGGRHLSELVAEADPIVRAAGRLMTSRSGGLGAWQTKSSIQALLDFAELPPTPALCTGALQIAAHYSRALVWLEARVRELRMLQASGYDASRQAVIAAGFAVGAAGPLNEERDLPDLLRRMIAALLPGDLARLSAGSPSVPAILAALRERELDKALANEPEARRDAIGRALAMIEASAYVAHAADAYGELAERLQESLGHFRQAHAESCICSR